jgi:hypothetical protein
MTRRNLVLGTRSGTQEAAHTGALGTGPDKLAREENAIQGVSHGILDTSPYLEA